MALNFRKYAFGREPTEQEHIKLSLAELSELIDAADVALDGDSHDAEHDALYSLREQLAEKSADLRRMLANRAGVKRLAPNRELLAEDEDSPWPRNLFLVGAPDKPERLRQVGLKAYSYLPAKHGGA